MTLKKYGKSIIIVNIAVENYPGKYGFIRRLRCISCTLHFVAQQITLVTLSMHVCIRTSRHQRIAFISSTVVSPAFITKINSQWSRFWFCWALSVRLMALFNLESNREETLYAWWHHHRRRRSIICEQWSTLFFPLLKGFLPPILLCRLSSRASVQLLLSESEDMKLTKLCAKAKVALENFHHGLTNFLRR